MKSEKKQRRSKVKETIAKNKNKIEIDLDKTPLNYFRLLKEMEKEKLQKELNQDMTDENQNNKKETKTINEKVYNKNVKKLGDYYNKNKDELILYGSHKYESLPMNNLIKEMGNYKKRVVDLFLNNNENNENKEKKEESSKISDIVKNYANCRDKVILTPLAINEKERSEMKKSEKKDFDEAERTGVVMRRIEYSTVVGIKADFDKNEKNKKMISKLKKSVDLIERFWLKFKRRKALKMKMNARFGRIQLQYISNYDNIKKFEKLEKKYNELNEIYEKEKEVMIY